MCINWKRDKFEKWYHRKYGVKPGDMSGGTAWTFPPEHPHPETVIIWTESNYPTNLVHECVHAANYTLESRGVKSDFNNDEPQAYLVEWIFAKAMGE